MTYDRASRWDVMDVSMEAGVEKRDASRIESQQPAGILIHSGEPEAPKPMISAFIWGGKVRPEPTLPFGRWKPTAA